MSMPTLAEGLDLGTSPVCSLVHSAGHGAVVHERRDCRVRHRVDRVRADEGVHVEKVRICRVLGRRRSPQRSLDMCALGLEGLPARPGEALEEQLVRQLRLRDSGFAREAQGALSLFKASRRRSTSVSTRLTKNDATLCTRDRSPPVPAKVSSPEM